MIALPIELAGEQLLLDPARGVYWPSRRTLLVADLHLGKAQAFRRHGIALPRGSTTADLERLSALLERHGAARLIILGDVTHAGMAAADWLASWQRFRDRHSDVAMVAVAGNHDRHGRLAELDFEVAQHAIDEPPFHLAHHPEPVADRYTLAGHLHPALKLMDAGSVLKLPVFWLGKDVGVLPAFTAFSGAGAIRPQPEDALYACAGDAIVKVPVQAVAGQAFRRA